MNNHVILEGHISIEAALRAQSRPIDTILIQDDKHSRQTHYLQRLARQFGVEVRRVPLSLIEEQTTGNSHGGMIALVGARSFVPIEKLVQNKKQPFIAMLDDIEDPYNMGYAIRALYAAGADGLVMRNRDWFSAASIIVRASGGASEYMATAVVESLEEAASRLRNCGLTIACASKRQAQSVYEVNLTIPLFLVIGGEKRGITRAFLDQADLLIQIPYGRVYRQSLGTAAATAVLAFEVMRQKQNMR